MKPYWQIVPKDDGCKYIGKDGDNHRLYDKGAKSMYEPILFRTEKEATEYIVTHLNPKDYKEERVMLDEKYYGIE